MINGEKTRQLLCNPRTNMLGFLSGWAKNLDGKITTVNLSRNKKISRIVSPEIGFLQIYLDRKSVNSDIQCKGDNPRPTNSLQGASTHSMYSGLPGKVAGISKPMSRLWSPKQGDVSVARVHLHISWQSRSRNWGYCTELETCIATSNILDILPLVSGT